MCSKPIRATNCSRSTLPTLRQAADAILALGRPTARARASAPTSSTASCPSSSIVPRDRYDSHVRERIGAHLAKVYEGRVSAYYPDFPEGRLARVHFIIGRDGTARRRRSITGELEARRSVTSSAPGTMRLTMRLRVPEPLRQTLALARHFPRDYRAVVGRRRGSDGCVNPALHVTRETDRDRLLPLAATSRRTGCPQDLSISAARFRCRAACRMLENMGFRVIASGHSTVRGTDGCAVFIHDMVVESAASRSRSTLVTKAALLQQTFLSVWRGLADNDAYNGLAQQCRPGAR